ncbi:MAG: DUF4832 domain-containing protein [Verrucomicrobiota bacterium]
MKHTPKNRMVVLRYPSLKHSIFKTMEPLTDKQAYNGTDVARTGHHNDCFLSSDNDVGTYNRDGLPMAAAMDYLAADIRHTLFGGETCALHDRSLPPTALPEMEKLQLTYLNSAYHPDVLERWETSDFMKTVERRMGPRLVLESLSLPEKGVSGSSIRLTFSIANRGFAALYNKRAVVLILRDSEEKKVASFPLKADPRHWKPGRTASFSAALTLPDELSGGNHSWNLSLPDVSPRLASDPRFCIRLANKDIWSEKTGEHRLVDGWPVTTN